jgi:perosamine synthetase
MKKMLSAYRIPREGMRRINRFIPKFEPVIMRHAAIPVCEPDLTKKEFDYVKEAMASSWISGSGPFVARFENEYAKRVSRTKYAITVNSGTSALHLALVACGIGPGDEVILPTFTMIASVNAVRYCGATPVLVDADPITWNMAVADIEKKITKKTRAIMPVHIYGLPVDMDPITKLAKKHGLWVIEDASEAHGATYKGKAVGSLGDIAAFSLFANKIIATGEGGIITTDNKKLADVIRLLRGHAFTPSHHFWHQYVGYSYEMTNLSAAVGLGQTERVTELIRKRRKNGARYSKLLRDIPGITVPVEPKGYTNVYWMYCILVDKKRYGMDRDALRAVLAKKGIETRTFFVPIHFQPTYYEQYKRETFPVSEMLCRDGLYLPSASTLTEQQIAAVVSVIRANAAGIPKGKKPQAPRR